MSEPIDAGMDCADDSEGIGFTEVVGSSNCVHRVSGITETIEGSASDKAPSPAHLLSVVLRVGTGRIAMTPDPRLVEHDPRNEPDHAHESAETDDDHFGSWVAP
ncbi:MAG TPA: hypothetical protein VMQ81_11550 [Acidimicrobiia bacterium]|nr:hypothetical protein [Acidimicrobiia bacterium]